VGPIIILDKSAFQALSARESLALNCHFTPNIVPVLVHEVLGDLTKTFRNGAVPMEKVRQLAMKFGGSGHTTNETYRLAVPASLIGEEVPMRGRIIPNQKSMFNGGGAVLIEPSPLNRLIMRLAAGQVTAKEFETSEIWRTTTRGLNFEPLRAFFERRLIVLAKSRTPDELGAAIDPLLNLPAMQRHWIACLAEMFGMLDSFLERVVLRWELLGSPPLRQFAPYAHYVLRVMLMLFVACRDRWLNWDPTHLIDAQYLFYLPFCSVFASDDRVHRLLGPQLLRAAERDASLRQSFVPGKLLKEGLKEIAAFEDSPSSDQRPPRGDYPPALENNVICWLWDRHMRPGRPADLSANAD
jgi:hypothetical protein